MLKDAPQDDQIEISIFGPGRGESIAVHLGNACWIVVDSCIDSETRSAVVLDYLNSIGVDVGTQVKIVVATHAHDDHFAGIATVFDACISAKFVCSSAFTTAEFMALTDLEKQEHVGLPVRAYSEFRKLHEIIESREDDGFEPLNYAWSQKRIYQTDGSGIRSTVIALSPSDRAFKRAMRALRKSLPTPDSQTYLPIIDPNELSIALWVEAAGKAILLGGDLPKGPSGLGWHAVVSEHHPRQKATVYKVAHHGSSTSHRQSIWSELLQRHPLSLIAPFNMGASSIPNEDDRARLISLSGEAYLTAPTTEMLSSVASRREAAALGSLAQNKRDTGRPGHVRARSRADESFWQVEVEKPAFKL